MMKLLANRTEAGKLLAIKLANYANLYNGLVLALPRGGVPVGFEIARALNLPLDIFLVRKLGTPRSKELAMGAIALGGVRVVNEGIMQWQHLSPKDLEQITATEQKELERRDKLYRGDRPFPDVRNRTIILVDDGVATGATLRVAIVGLKQQQVASIIVAVPVACISICEELGKEVEQVVCLNRPEHLSSISVWYQDFSQTTDEEVRYLLDKSQSFVPQV
jgi:predicted phosphoribosyltransferase